MNATESRPFVIGRYWTKSGYRVEICGVTDDGNLVGRYDVRSQDGESSVWMAGIWQPDGKHSFGLDTHDLVDGEQPARVRQTYWLNIFSGGPGLLRKNWEEALIEASRSEEPCLCRVEVKVDAFVGEGLR